ncbi:MAG: hypothetical protein U9O89_05460 [Thermoproteota archaeon]|nr:hypothetical protein [Thermoproteota archaeon]
MKTIRKRSNKRTDSGQILLVAALAVALILTSTTVYIYELNETLSNTEFASLNHFVSAVKLGSQHVMIGSLTNISSGGANETLVENLEKWASLLERQYKLGKCTLNFTPLNAPPYSSGIWTLWGSDGLGVSSACSNFSFQLSGREVDVKLSYTINITTTILVEGSYKVLGGDEKQVNVTCNLLNEGVSALAKNLTLYYESSGRWLVANSSNNYVLVDYGNGTYCMSFTVNISLQNVLVSVHAYDQKEIFVRANATCTEI